MPASPALAVDVRARSEYEAGHIPWSVNIPMDDADQVVATTANAWAETLGTHGVGNDLEVVIVDETITQSSTLLFWLLEYLGDEQVVSAEEVPTDLPVDDYRHVPWAQNLTDDGELDTAGALWTLYEEAGVSYFSEIICYSDKPAEATLTYFVLRLLGFPKVVVYLP